MKIIILYKGGKKLFLKKIRTGLLSNGNNEFYVSNLKIQNLVCETEWKVNEENEFFTDSANFYEEIFDLSLPLK